MVSGSGLRTALADRIKSLTHVHPQLLILAATLSAASSCVYFNAYYNAGRLFDEGRRDIEAGREANGHAALASSIEKAEGIVAENPNSRWADDALRLIVQARLLRREWEEALEASYRLLRYSATRRDSTEVAGYQGIARLHLGDAQGAETLLSLALTREDGEDRRARLLYNRALARARLGRFAEADADLVFVWALRPEWVRPRIDRVGLLVDEDRVAEAALELAAILELRLTESEELAIVETVENVAATSPRAVIQGLAEVESSVLDREFRARLVKLRADLRLARGSSEAARADYELAARLAPQTRAAVDAQLAAARLALAAASAPDAVSSVRRDLERLLQRRTGGQADVMRLWDMLVRVEYWLGLGGLGFWLAAEKARDELEAPRLARSLFLRYAEEEPESVWAPKALLAVLELGELDSLSLAELRGPDAGELRRRLWRDYRNSPYVQAVLGERPSDGLRYEELELGLQRQLDRLEELADQEVMARRSTGSR